MHSSSMRNDRHVNADAVTLRERDRLGQSPPTMKWDKPKKMRNQTGQFETLEAAIRPSPG